MQEDRSLDLLKISEFATKGQRSRRKGRIEAVNEDLSDDLGGRLSRVRRLRLIGREKSDLDIEFIVVWDSDEVEEADSSFRRFG